MFILNNKKAKVIIIRFKGGLGNQMFQYAAGRYLSYLRGCGLKMDISPYNQVNYRKFGLKYFNIQEQYIRKTLLSRICYKLKVKLGLYSIYSESIPGNIKEFGNLPANTILDGYWQSEKYFINIESVIRKDFTFKQEEILSDSLVAKNIKSSNSISVHIRRGDYITNPLFNKVHGVCDINYYRTAMDYFISKVSDPHFYLFSDDMTWVRENIKITHPHTFIDEQIYSAIPADITVIDLFLMNLCKHNIIANSSYSWWGAWLNKNPSKIVIAPRKWVNDESIIDSTSLIPGTWIRI